MTAHEHLTTEQLDALERLWRSVYDMRNSRWLEWATTIPRMFPALLDMARRALELEAENARLRGVIEARELERIEQERGGADDTWRG